VQRATVVPPTVGTGNASQSFNFTTGLRQRLPGYRRERHLGEAIYLLVRAVGLAPEAGIWRHRFDDALIDAADAALAGRLTGAAA